MTNERTPHTPGPWYYVCGAVWTTPDGPDDGGKGIALRARAGTGPTEPDLAPTEKDANMRLIAAAPALLDALVALLDEHAGMNAELRASGRGRREPDDGAHPDSPAYRAASAIAAVKGEQS